MFHPHVSMISTLGIVYLDCAVTYISRLQQGGFSIRCPALRCWYMYCPATVGYGVPPSVMISHSNTPNDQLQRIQQFIVMLDLQVITLECKFAVAINII